MFITTIQEKAVGYLESFSNSINEILAKLCELERKDKKDTKEYVDEKEKLDLVLETESDFLKTLSAEDIEVIEQKMSEKLSTEGNNKIHSRIEGIMKIIKGSNEIEDSISKEFLLNCSKLLDVEAHSLENIEIKDNLIKQKYDIMFYPDMYAKYGNIIKVIKSNFSVQHVKGLKNIELLKLTTEVMSKRCSKYTSKNFKTNKLYGYFSNKRQEINFRVAMMMMTESDRQKFFSKIPKIKQVLKKDEQICGYMTIRKEIPESQNR